MTYLDRLLQRWRISMARPHIAPGASVLDVGCADASLFRQVPAIGRYVGIDPAVRDEVRRDGFTLIRGAFPDVVPPHGGFDAIVMLASIEHVPEAALPALAKTSNTLLRGRGRVIITVPDARVDAILEVLAFLRIIDVDAMKVGEHHGFEANRTAEPFERSGFELVAHRRFQLGLNNCFVLEKVEDLGCARPARGS